MGCAGRGRGFGSIPDLAVSDGPKRSFLFDVIDTIFSYLDPHHLLISRAALRTSAVFKTFKGPREHCHVMSCGCGALPFKESQAGMDYLKRNVPQFSCWRDIRFPGHVIGLPGFRKNPKKK
jgi:hypothetical protein